MYIDLLIKDCSILTPDFEIEENRYIAIKDSLIVEIGNAASLLNKYKSKKTLSGKGKLLMPGLVDAHTHTCQQLLRGRTQDEYPMIWTRILVPFESNLDEETVYTSAKLSCLEMIKSGTTSFADSGGPYMHKVAEATIESGLRATITKSSMDMGKFIPETMLGSPDEIINEIESLYKDYHGSGDGRIHIWFGLRQVMTCSPNLIQKVAEKASVYRTGIHAHLAEHRDEVSFCLQKYQKRPAEVLDEYGALGPNLLTAHNVVLSEQEIDLLSERQVKIVHCPRNNFASHGFPKTPRLLQAGLSIGLGSDGAAGSSLSLFDEMRVLRSGIHAYWGIPTFDPMVLPAKTLLEMVTLGGAKALQLEREIGTIQIGKKADLILINIEQPHISPTYNMVNTIVEAVNSKDVTDVVINGSVIMENREVLTLDEERILFESKLGKQLMQEKAKI